MERNTGFEPIPSAWKAESSPRRNAAFGTGGEIRTRSAYALVLETSIPLQLYRTCLWCRSRDSNPRPTDYKSVALPAELERLYLAVGLGVEPSQPFQVVRISNPLHYRPAPRPFILWDVTLQHYLLHLQQRLVLLRHLSL